LQNIGLHSTIAKGFCYAAKTVYGLGGGAFQFLAETPGEAKRKCTMKAIWKHHLMTKGTEEKLPC